MLAFLSDPNALMRLVGYVVILVALLIASNYHQKNRRAALDLIERQADKGHALDPQVVERLLSESRGPNPQWITVAGTALLAVGIGSGIAAAVAHSPPDWVAGAGKAAVSVCTGAGLLIAGLVLARLNKR